MVYGVASRIAEKAIRASGLRLIERYTKTFTRYDKKIFRNLYGRSGGRGVRHGRDIGAAVGGLMATQRGDDLDGPRIGNPARKIIQTRRGRGNKYSSRSSVCRACNRGVRQSNYRKSYSRGNRKYY